MDRRTPTIELSLKELFSRWFTYYQLATSEVDPPVELAPCAGKEILFITKFPPLIGGVATQEYWRARELARRGFRVSIVTNANEAEEHERCTNRPLADVYMLNLDFPETGGKMRTFFTELSYSSGAVRPEHYHIPMDAMAQSKLVGLAFCIVKQYQPALIITGYLEPYAGAAVQVQNLTGLPIYLSFAGSDIDRLANIPELAQYFAQIFPAVTSIATSIDKMGRLLALGVPFYKVLPTPPATIFPEEIFTPEGPLLFPKTDPTELRVGIYGKYSAQKGWEELLLAVARIRERGSKVRLLCLVASKVQERLLHKVQEPGWQDIVQWIEPVPVWEVPAFLRSCDVVCLLENNFPIKIHAPITPLETALTGVCPLLSSEMFNKLRISGLALDRNCLLVENPKDVECIAEVLEYAANHLSEVRERGRLAALDVRNCNDFPQRIEKYIKILTLTMGRAGNKVYQVTCHHPQTITQLMYICHTYYPVTLACFREYRLTGSANWVPEQGTTLEMVQAYGEYLLQKCEAHLTGYVGENAGEVQLVKDAIAFELARVKVMRKCTSLGMLADTPQCNLPNVVTGSPQRNLPNVVTGSLESSWALLKYDPVRMSFIAATHLQMADWVVYLRYEPEIITVSSNIDEIYHQLGRHTLHLAAGPVRKILLACTPGLQINVLEMQDSFEQVLALIDGKRTVQDISYLCNSSLAEMSKMLNTFHKAGLIGWRLNCYAKI